MLGTPISKSFESLIDNSKRRNTVQRIFKNITYPDASEFFQLWFVSQRTLKSLNTKANLNSYSYTKGK